MQRGVQMRKRHREKEEQISLLKELESQPVEILELGLRAQNGLKKHGIKTLGELKVILSGSIEKANFLKIRALGEMHRIIIMHRMIRLGLITADDLGKYSKDKTDVDLWESYRKIMKDYH